MDGLFHPFATDYITTADSRQPTPVDEVIAFPFASLVSSVYVIAHFRLLFTTYVSWTS